MTVAIDQYHYEVITHDRFFCTFNLACLILKSSSFGSRSILTVTHKPCDTRPLPVMSINDTLASKLIHKHVA